MYPLDLSPFADRYSSFITAIPDGFFGIRILLESAL